jgi:hypothetical protein
MNNNKVTMDEVKDLRLNLAADLTDIEHLYTDTDYKQAAEAFAERAWSGNS